MKLSAAVGTGQGLNGRSASIQATRDALDQLGSQPVQFGFVICADQFDINGVLNGVTSLLGNTPVFGTGTKGLPLAGAYQSRCCQVMLLSGDDLQVRANWWPVNHDAGSGFSRQIMAGIDHTPGLQDYLWLAVDGFSNFQSDFYRELIPHTFPLIGLLGSGEYFQQATAQLGGSSAGRGGLSAAWLSGGLRVGVGRAHGWVSSGSIFSLSQVKNNRLSMLNDQPTAQIYAQTLGGDESDWVHPPLNQLVRTYPLGFELPTTSSFRIMPPICFEKDGNLLFNRELPEGQLANLMIGSRATAAKAIRHAVQMAAEALGKAELIAALVFIDLAWANILEADPGFLSSSLELEIGSDIPIMAGYSLGHVLRLQAGNPPEHSQGEFLVVLLGIGR